MSIAPPITSFQPKRSYREEGRRTATKTGISLYSISSSSSEGGSEMAVSVKQMSLMVALLGIISFVFGVIAENKKPAAGTPIPGKDVVICKYPSDPTVALGYLSFGFLIATTGCGFLSILYPYKGKSVPRSALFQSTSFLVFIIIALLSGGLAAALLLWPTIQEHSNITNNIHHNMDTKCSTAKTGLLGGGAFLSLDSALFWLVALMLADNARKDYLEEDEDEQKGEYGQVLATDYNAPAHLKGTA